MIEKSEVSALIPSDRQNVVAAGDADEQMAATRQSMQGKCELGDFFRQASFALM